MVVKEVFLARTVVSFLLCAALGLVAHADNALREVDLPYQVNVSVNGKTLPVRIEQGTRLQQTYFVQLPADTPSEITVRAMAGHSPFSLKPDRYSADAKTEPGTIKFRLSDETPRIIKSGAHPYLFLFPQRKAAAPDSAAPNLVAISPEDDSAAEHTQRIQSSIDRLAAAGGGTVYLHAGIHRVRAVHLKSRVSLFLDGGAVLQGTGSPAGYEGNHGRRALIVVDQAEGASICGPGIIDGAGSILQKKHNTKAHLIDAVSCRNLRIEDVVLRDPGAWTVHLIGCSGVSIRRVKILGDWMLANTDGIDPDMSDNVHIEDCFIYSGDDALVVKTTGTLGLTRPSFDITMRNCIVMTRKTSCKIGTESRYDIRDVLFEKIEIVDSSRGCALWMRDGATYSNITFRNIRMNLMRLAGEQWSGEAYRVSIQERNGRGRMKNILFDRIEAQSPQRSVLFSKVPHPLSGVTFNNCVWRAEADGAIPHIEVDNARDISFINCFTKRNGIHSPFTEKMIQGPSRRHVRVEQN